MNLERGLESGPIRIRLIFQSADVQAHSIMSDKEKAFSLLADEVQDFAQKKLASFVAKGIPAKERLL